MPIVHATLTLGPFATNTYVLVCEATRDTALIDVGFEPEAVAALLHERRLTPRLLLNTHAHYDHVCGVRMLQDELGGEFWLHPGDRRLLDHLAEQGAASGCRRPARPRWCTTWPMASASRSATRRSRSSTPPGTRPAA